MPRRRGLYITGLSVALLAGLGFGATVATAQDRNTRVLNDRDRVEAAGFWLYNKLDQGFEQSKKTGKPLLVVLRCVPCAHCAGLDDSLVERDQTIQKLLEQFVCVRQVYTNGLDLRRFQYDYDQSWTALMFNADGTLYGRYGTRSHQTESANDVSLAGFSRALEGALAIHKGYPANRALLQGKQGVTPDVPSPEQYPTLQKYPARLTFGPMVAKECIHCHMVGEAKRTYYRLKPEPMPAQVLFPYPNPRVLGVTIDPLSRSTVKAVAPGSPASAAGLKTGDEITQFKGQAILSTGDLQWVLHHTDGAATLPLVVKRGAGQVNLTLNLPQGWREKDDLSWRVSSWDLRRMVTGGMLLEELPAAERSSLGIAEDRLALRAKHVGEYGEHAVAKRAGFQKGDILVAVDGRSERFRETDLFARLIREKRKGEKVACTVKRGGQTLELSYAIQ